MSPNKIILASNSQIRRDMLIEAKVVFDIISPLCDEENIKLSLKNISLLEKSLELAKAKAKSVSDIYINSYVIGSDQICEINGNVVSKSKNIEEAFLSLKMLSGNTHRQNNGTCVYLNGKCIAEHSDFAELKMKKLTDEEINSYIKLDNPIGCAGSYKFEMNGKNLFDVVKGDENIIKGFSLIPLYKVGIL